MTSSPTLTSMHSPALNQPGSSVTPLDSIALPVPAATPPEGTPVGSYCPVKRELFHTLHRCNRVRNGFLLARTIDFSDVYPWRCPLFQIARAIERTVVAFVAVQHRPQLYVRAAWPRCAAGNPDAMPVWTHGNPISTAVGTRRHDSCDLAIKWYQRRTCRAPQLCDTDAA